MNMFQNLDGLFGCLDSEVTNDSLLSLFRLAKQIRLRLGKQGYLLDCYLSLIFEGLNNKLVHESADDGFHEGGSLQVQLFHIMAGMEPKKTGPFYPRMQEIYEQKKGMLEFQELHTNQTLLFFSLADEMMADATSRFVKEQVNRLNGIVDEVYLQDLYERISHQAGEAMLEELNTRIRQRFLMAPLATVFAQGITNELLFQLTDRDRETSRQMFQLLLDTLPDTP